MTNRTLERDRTDMAQDAKKASEIAAMFKRGEISRARAEIELSRRPVQMMAMVTLATWHIYGIGGMQDFMVKVAKGA